MTEADDREHIALRDLFAAVALHALLATPMRPLAPETAYELADAMLKARATSPTPR